MRRSTKWTALITIAALTATIVAPSQSGARMKSGRGRAGNGTSDKELARDFRQATDGAAAQLVSDIQQVAKTTGLTPGNGTITAVEVGAANYQTLVDEIAAIGDKFDEVTSYPSQDAHLAAWAIAAYAQPYDDNPKAIPIFLAIGLLFVAAALIFAPLVYQSIGTTLEALEAWLREIEGIPPLLAPALRSFAEGGGNKKAQPLVSAADQQEIRDELASKGLTGDAPDGVARMVTLAASLVIADARR